MTSAQIIRLRRRNQRLNRPVRSTIAETVAHFGAVQAQEYESAKWALGLRTSGATAASVEEAVARGEILRTHVLRPTWHFVHPADIVWMLELTAPRIRAAMAYVDRQHGIDAKTRARSTTAIARALEGGRHLTRTEIAAVLAKARIKTSNVGVLHLCAHAELDGVICSGARRGKQATYALLDERVRKPKRLHREEALANLVKRYFTSHGPATIADCAWWSGLTIADVRRGIAAAGELSSWTVDDREYWMAHEADAPRAVASVLLLPSFDEYVVAYADRSAVLKPEHKVTTRNGIFSPIIVVDGKIVGTWSRSIASRKVSIRVKTFDVLASKQRQQLHQRIADYSAFLGVPVELVEIARTDAVD